MDKKTLGLLVLGGAALYLFSKQKKKEKGQEEEEEIEALLAPVPIAPPAPPTALALRPWKGPRDISYRQGQMMAFKYFVDNGLGNIRDRRNVRITKGYKNMNQAWRATWTKNQGGRRYTHFAMVMTDGRVHPVDNANGKPVWIDQTPKAKITTPPKPPIGHPGYGPEGKRYSVEHPEGSNRYVKTTETAYLSRSGGPFKYRSWSVSTAANRAQNAATTAQLAAARMKAEARALLPVPAPPYWWSRARALVPGPSWEEEMRMEKPPYELLRAPHEALKAKYAAKDMDLAAYMQLVAFSLAFGLKTQYPAPLVYAVGGVNVLAKTKTKTKTKANPLAHSSYDIPDFGYLGY